MCTPHNWNHFYTIFLNGSYLLHTESTTTVSRLYPLVTTSLTEILHQRMLAGLMHAFRPDWWDIGRNQGPRSFITILTIAWDHSWPPLSGFFREKVPDHDAGGFESAPGTGRYASG